MVAGIYFMKNLMLAIFTKLLSKALIQSKIYLSSNVLLFCGNPICLPRRIDCYCSFDRSNYRFLQNLSYSFVWIKHFTDMNPMISIMITRSLSSVSLDDLEKFKGFLKRFSYAWRCWNGFRRCLYYRWRTSKSSNS